MIVGDIEMASGLFVVIKYRGKLYLQFLQSMYSCYFFVKIYMYAYI